MIDKSVEKLKERNITINVDESVVEYIAKVGFDENYGARPLKRAVQSKIEDEISEYILDGKIKDNTNVTMKVVDDKIVISNE